MVDVVSLRRGFHTSPPDGVAKLAVLPVFVVVRRGFHKSPTVVIIVDGFGAVMGWGGVVMVVMVVVISGVIFIVSRFWGVMVDAVSLRRVFGFHTSPPDGVAKLAVLLIDSVFELLIVVVRRGFHKSPTVVGVEIIIVDGFGVVMGWGGVVMVLMVVIDDAVVASRGLATVGDTSDGGITGGHIVLRVGLDIGSSRGRGFHTSMGSPEH